MDNSVIIKGLNNGIIVVLDSEIEFDLLKEKVSKKFRDSSKFLGNAQVALSFEGRKLTEEQQLELLQIISEQSELKIVCLVLDDPEKEDFFTNEMMNIFRKPDEKIFEFFSVFKTPEPDELIYVTGYETGRTFRSGCAYYRGRGKVFYFQPGHETNPTYRDKNIQKVIKNAVYWVAPNRD